MKRSRDDDTEEGAHARKRTARMRPGDATSLSNPSPSASEPLAATQDIVDDTWASSNQPLDLDQSYDIDILMNTTHRGSTQSTHAPVVPSSSYSTAELDKLSTDQWLLATGSLTGAQPELSAQDNAWDQTITNSATQTVPADNDIFDGSNLGLEHGDFPYHDPNPMDFMPAPNDLNYPGDFDTNFDTNFGFGFETQQAGTLAQFDANTTLSQQEFDFSMAQSGTLSGESWVNEAPVSYITGTVSTPEGPYPGLTAATTPGAPYPMPPNAGVAGQRYQAFQPARPSPLGVPRPRQHAQITQAGPSNARPLVPAQTQRPRYSASVSPLTQPAHLPATSTTQQYSQTIPARQHRDELLNLSGQTTRHNWLYNAPKGFRNRQRNRGPDDETRHYRPTYCCQCKAWNRGWYSTEGSGRKFCVGCSHWWGDLGEEREDPRCCCPELEATGTASEKSLGRGVPQVTLDAMRLGGVKSVDDYYHARFFPNEPELPVTPDKMQPETQ